MDEEEKKFIRNLAEEIAEKNKYNFKRKMNLDHEVWWDFEIRVKN